MNDLLFATVSPQISSSSTPVFASIKKPQYDDSDSGRINGRLKEYGNSGTSITNGYIYEEQNAKLTGYSGMQIYEKMRRTDAQVFATLLVCELPIRATDWFIQPATNEEDESTDQDWEVADFVSNNFFNLLDKTWDSLLIEIMTMLPFGYSLFEKVYASQNGKIILKKLAYRKQTTIQKWEMSNGLPGVTQLTSYGDSGSETLEIPAWKLVLFSHRQEGDNYEGVSILRSAHRNYYFKDKLYTFAAIRHERQSVGVPVIYLPSGAGEDDKKEAADIGQNIRASERSVVVVPGPKEDGWLVEFMDLKASASTGLKDDIDHHNREIAKNVLAQFIELGNTESGSRALDESQQGLFLLSLTALAKQIADTINRHVIPELVNLNFNGITEYPKLTFNPIGYVDIASVSSALSSLAGAEIIHPDETLEAHVRKVMKLPPKDKEPAVQEEEGLQDEGGDEDGGNPTGEGDTDPEGELDALTSELESLASDDEEEESFSDLASIVITDLDLYVESFAERKPMSEETKKKISEALKKRGGGELKSDKKTVESDIEQNRADLESTNDEYRQKIGELRGQIDEIKSLKDSLPKGKAGTAQRKQIAEKARALLKQIEGFRKERDAKIEPLKKLRRANLNTRKAVNAEIKARKAAISEMVKGIRSIIQQKRKSVKDAVTPLRDQVKANTEEIQSIRKSLAGLPKDSPQREALKAMIEGLQNESKDVRAQTEKIRSDFAGQRDNASAEVERVKSASGLYNENKEHLHDHGPSVFADSAFMEVSARVNNRFIIDLQNECRTPEDKAIMKRKGFVFNEYEEKSPRVMTFAEKKVNFSSLSRSMDSFSSKLAEEIADITARQKEDLLAQVKKAVEANDISAVGNIKAHYAGDLAQALTNVQKEMFEIGKQSASKEMGVMNPPTKSEVKGALRVQNDALVDGFVNDMETSVKTSVTQLAQKHGGEIAAVSAPQAVAAVSEALDKIIAKNAVPMGTLGVTGAVNMGRASIFERYPEKIYAMQFSAILDESTTDTCRSLDGRLVKPGSREFYDYAPPRHENCRSIWVEILQDETYKPEIGGIPSSIPANQTVQTYQKMQAPVILKDSPARKSIENELKDRQEKLAALEKEGKFPNRQADHKKRIEELEKSLSDADSSEKAFSESVREVLKADGINLI